MSNGQKQYEYVLNDNLLIRFTRLYKEIEVYNIDTGKWHAPEHLSGGVLMDGIKISEEKAKELMANPDRLRTNETPHYPDPWDD